MKKTLSLLCIIILLACETEPSQNNSSVSTENASFVSEEGEQKTLHNTFFKHYSYIENEKRKNYILKIKQTEKINLESEFTDSEFEISSNNPDWKINTKAHQIDFKNNTLILENIADFDHENTFSAYNIETGEHLLDYTYGNLTARIPSSNFKRYIGFVARSNNKKLLSKYSDEVIGLLTYASDESTLQQILIKSKEDIGTTTPGMDLVALTEGEQLYENDQLLYFMDLKPDFESKDINFAFGLTFYIGELSVESALLFEVKEDKISIKEAKYDTSVFELKKD